MNALFEGIALGFGLSFLIGPLLFAIVQAGLERGFRAGLAVGAGIWASDVLYAALTVFGLRWLERLSKIPDFNLKSGLVGGSLLIAFGIGNLIAKPPAPDFKIKQAAARRSLLRYALKGFLLNTVNPFTVFFWLGISTAVLAPKGWAQRQSLVFFAGMLGTLVTTDAVKAFFSEKIAHWLTPHHVWKVKMGIGLLLLFFGAAMIFRSF